MAKSLTIKNKNNEILYPKTVSSLVYDNTTGNTVKLDIDTLKGLVVELSGVDNAFFGGIVETSNAIVTDYSTNGYSGVYLYMVGSDMSSLVAYLYNGSGSPILLFEGSTYDFTDYTEVKDELIQLKLELYNTKNETKFLSKLNNAANISSNKITSVAGYYLFYAPVKNGDTIKIESTNDTSKTIITGFTSELPAIDVAVTSIVSQSSASFNKTLTAPADGYVVISSYGTYHTNKKVSIGECVSMLGTMIDAEQGVVTSAADTQMIYYIPMKTGDKFHITATNSVNVYFRYGFTVTVPTIDTQVLLAQAIFTSNVELDITAVHDGYFVFSHSSPYFTDTLVSVYVSKLNKIESDISEAKELLNDIAFVKLKYAVVQYKKITQNGEVADASAESNRTLIADVSNFVGKTLYLDGILYSAANTYCWYSFFDSNGSLISKSNVSYGTAQQYLQEPVVVPEGAATLYVQGSTASIFPDAKSKVNDAVNLRNNKSIRRFPLYFGVLRGGYGTISTSTSYDNKANKHTINYIRVHDTIKICNLGGITQSIIIYFYDKSLAFMSSINLSDLENGLDYVDVENIPGNAKWFRVSFGLANTSVGSRIEYTKFHVDIESEWGDGEETSKEPYVEYYPFLYTVKVNMPTKIADNPSIITKTIFAYDEGLIHLPSTYTPNGKPTPLIFFIHGDAERYEPGESTFSGHMKMQQCWSDAGFALVDLDLIPSCYNEPTMASTGGTRDDLECLSAAWEFLTNHFNIDKRGFYLIGRSRGGQAVLEILGKGGTTRLPILAAISMAGANSIFEYSVYSVANEKEWQLWCNAHGLPTTGRPTWGRTDTTKSFLTKTECYNFVIANWDLWWRKALTGWGLITKNVSITPIDYFNNVVVPYANNQSDSSTVLNYFATMISTMEAKSPVPIRFDWCIGDTTQSRLPFTSSKGYSCTTVEIMLNTPGSLAEYRQWDGVDESNPYDETNPHYAENMIFYNGDLTLPNGVVTSNPSKVTMEWLIWCMGKDPRYLGMNYTLPW